MMEGAGQLDRHARVTGGEFFRFSRVVAAG